MVVLRIFLIVAVIVSIAEGIIISGRRVTYLPPQLFFGFGLGFLLVLIFMWKRK